MIATLDFLLWMVAGILIHSYFEKPMRTPYVIMSEHQHMSILANELVRRLSNVHPEVIDQEIVEIIEHYMLQLKTSGYDRSQAKEIIVSGVIGWKRKRRRREAEFYRSAKSTLSQRTRKKLIEKTSWFREKRKREG